MARKPRVYEIHPTKLPKDKRLPGKTRRWPTPEAMYLELDEYFEKAEKKGWHITIGNMKAKLGIADQTWHEYRHREEYTAVTEWAKRRCENYLVNRMLDQEVAPATGIFLLKNNHGYKDKVEQEVTHTHNVADSLEQKRLKQVEEMKARLLPDSSSSVIDAIEVDDDE